MKQRRTSHRRNAAVQPRWGWSGVAEIAEPQRVDEILMSVASSLPSHRSPLKQIAEELLALGARYHRYLHQDEFGPSRAQRMAALRVLLDYLDLLLSRLFSLPEHLRLCLSAAFALYSPSQSSSYCHDATVEQLYEVTVDVERALIRINAVDDAELMVQIRDVAQSTFEFLSSLDSTTDAEVFMEAALSIDLIGGDASSAGSFSNVCARLERLRRLFRLTVGRLEDQHGPAKGLSLPLLVWQLCDLWHRETGQAVTSSAVRDYVYTSAPQSAAGRFVLAAVEALRPPEAWMREHESPDAPVRAKIIMATRCDQAPTVYVAMRDYVASHPPSGVRRGRRKAEGATF